MGWGMMIGLIAIKMMKLKLSVLQVITPAKAFVNG
jgi:hypothetical protein